jgi:hypothetical protein
MKPEIAKLACWILDESEFKEASALAEIYLKVLDRYPFERFFKLDNKIGMQLPSHTKYPIMYRSIIRSIKYYCQVEIQRGIIFPRNFVSNVCAHLESSAKLLLDQIEPQKYPYRPLGPVLDRLGQLSVSPDLVNKAKALNKLIYVRVKHFWDVPDDEHLFEQDDAVLIYFAARKLAKQLLDVEGIIIPLEEVQNDPDRIPF